MLPERFEPCAECDARIAEIERARREHHDMLMREGAAAGAFPLPERLR